MSYEVTPDNSRDPQESIERERESEARLFEANKRRYGTLQAERIKENAERARQQRIKNLSDDRHIYSLVQADGPMQVIELADGGKRFRKQLVKFGTWADPHNRTKGKMVLDKTWGQKIVDNFKNKIVGRVPVPLGHPDTAAELAQLNRGELVDMDIQDDGLYGTLDIRDPKTAQDIENDLLWDVSISFDNQYVDTKGKPAGPTLFHVGLLTDPYLKGMQPFQALANGVNAIMLSENEDNHMSSVKNEREFPVTIKYKDGEEDKEVTLEPGKEVEVPDEANEDVSKQVQDAVAPAAETTSEEAAADGASDHKKEEANKDTSRVAELEKELADSKAALATKELSDSYEKLLKDGKLVPAQKALFLSLSSAGTSQISLTDGSTKSLHAMITELLEAGPKRVDFSEKGADSDEGGEKTPYDELSDSQKETLEAMGTSPDEYNEANK